MAGPVLQVVDTEAFAKQQAAVDFDVNNLKLSFPGGIQVKHEGEIRVQGRDRNQILSNCRVKTLLVLKPAQEVTARIDKMKQRGWAVTFP